MTQILIPISEIRINPERPAADLENVEALVASISELGLLNPITIDRAHVLIAGMHRLEAVKQLGWTEIECTVSSLEGLSAELAEIDENLIRRNLHFLDEGEQLIRRKEIYELLHPETKQGMRNGKTYKNEIVSFLQTKSFAVDTSEKTKASRRSIEQKIQIAMGLIPTVKVIVRESGIGFNNALKLSRLLPEQQEEAAGQLAAKKIRVVDEYMRAKELESGSEKPTWKVPSPESALEKPDPPVFPDPLEPEQFDPSVSSDVPPEGPIPKPPILQDTVPKKPTSSTAPRMPRAKKSERSVDTVLEESTEISEQSKVPAVPFTLGEKKFATIRESVADLKNPDKDCSCTPDGFLAEITAFVQKFLRDIEWYSMPYYEAVYPALSPVQREYLRQQLDSVRAGAKTLFKRIEGK